MLHLFNRAELFITCDLNRFHEVQNALLAADIDYQYRTKDLAGSHCRARTGAFGLHDDARVEYKLYVKRADLDRARSLL